MAEASSDDAIEVIDSDNGILENGHDSVSGGKQPTENIDNSEEVGLASQDDRVAKKKKKKKKKTPKGPSSSTCGTQCCQHNHGPKHVDSEYSTHAHGLHDYRHYPADGNGDTVTTVSDGDKHSAGMSPTSAKEMHKAFKRMFIDNRNAAGTDDKSKKDKKYQFWDTQPVPKLGERSFNNLSSMSYFQLFTINVQWTFTTYPTQYTHCSYTYVWF